MNTSSRNGFQEFSDANSLAVALGMDSSRISRQMDLDDIFQKFREFPEYDNYFQIIHEPPQVRPGVLGALIPRTKYFVNMQELKKPDGLFMTFLLEVAFDFSLEVAAFLGAALHIGGNVTKLTDLQLTVVKAFLPLVEENPYKKTIEEEKLRRSLNELERSELNDVLDQLIEKGIIKRHDSGKLSLSC